ncbi:MAG: hypothetical protein ACE5FY_03545 [Nitrospiria bacterium]
MPIKTSAPLVVILIVGLISSVFLGIPWDIFSVNFVVLLGATQGLFSIILLLSLLGNQCLDDDIIPAGIISLSFAPMALLLLPFLLKKGGPALFYWSRFPGDSLWLTSSAFFARNFIGSILFYSVVFSIFYKAINKKKIGPQLSCICLIFFVLNQTFISWDFGMSLSPGWHNTLFAPYYWFGSLYVGLAIFMLIILSSRKKPLMQMTRELKLRPLLLSFSAIWFYLWWSQFITIWYANIPEETEPFYMRFTGDQSYFAFLVLLALFIIPFGCILLGLRKGKALKPVLWTVLAGHWIERYLIVVPPIRHLNTSLHPTGQIFNWRGGITTILLFACFLLLLSLFYGRVQKMVAAKRVI